MRRTLWVLAFGQYSFVTSVFIVIGILPRMAEFFHISIATVATAVGLFSIVYAISGPVLSAAAGTLNRRNLLIGSLLIFSVTNAIAAMTSDFTLLLAMRLISAACDGFYAATATAMASALAAPQRRGRALSVVNSGITIAFVAGIPLGSFIGARLGWQATFWFLCILGLLTALGLAMVLPRDVRLAKVTSVGERLRALAQPAVLLLVLVTIFSYAGVFSIYTFIAPSLRTLTGVDGAAISAFLLAFGLSTIVGNVVGGLLTDFWSPSRTMLVGFVLLAVLLFAFPLLMRSPLGAGFLIVVMGFIHYTALTPLQHRFTLVNPQQADVVIGLCFAAFYVGISLASYSGGFLLTHFGAQSLGFGAGFWKLAAGAALVASLVTHRVPERPAAPVTV